ncbi:IclR family transcriptional regulator [soil metagenome]
MARPKQPTIRLIGSVERAIAVLEGLAGADGDLGTNEIARRTGVNPSSVSRLLATLQAGELVGYVPDTGRYRPGLRLLHLANAAVGRLDLRDAARPYLARLVAATGETATLSVPGDREAVTVDFLQGPSSVQSIARVGRPSVAHATAVGKLFLAHGGELPEGRLPRYTGRTIVARAAVAAEAEQARKRGWATAVCEREDDLSAIAAPVRSDRSELAAMLWIQGPAVRFGACAMHEVLPLLLSSARSLSAELGAVAAPGDRAVSSGRSAS